MTGPCPRCGGGGRYRPEGCAPWCADLVLEQRPVFYPNAHHDSVSEWWAYLPKEPAS